MSVPEPYGGRKRHVRLTEAQRAEVIKRRAAGEPCSALVRDYGVTRQTIMNICRGYNWRSKKADRKAPAKAEKIVVIPPAKPVLVTPRVIALPVESKLAYEPSRQLAQTMPRDYFNNGKAEEAAKIAGRGPHRAPVRLKSFPPLPGEPGYVYRGA